MKILSRLSLLAVILATLLSATALLPVAAASTSISDAQISRIRGNCVSAVSTLNQLQISDTLLRVNRGQLYESISTKLMAPFNTRIARNSFTITDLSSDTNNYNQALDTFRSDYQAYEEQLSTAINVDCAKQPVDFYNAVALARTKRNQVHSDVIQLNNYLDTYSSDVSAFEQAIQGAGK